MEFFIPGYQAWDFKLSKLGEIFGHLFRNMTKTERAFHTLKHYMFECQCLACSEDWPLEDGIHDEIYRIPTFEQEKIYKVRFGDKKEVVSQIIEARREVEKCMSYNRFREALASYQTLCLKLEENLRHPHAYFLQARSGIIHSVWNLYCTQFPQREIDEDIDITANREFAKTIYKNDFGEEISTNEALSLGDSEEPAVAATSETTNSDLYNKTRQMLEQSSQKFSDLKGEQDRIEKEKQESLLAAANLPPSTSVPTSLEPSTEGKEGTENARSKLETLLKPSAEELEIQNRQQEYLRKCREEEQRIKDLKKKQWAEEDQERRNKEEERKLRRAKETEEKIRRGNYGFIDNEEAR